jgi:hypothetical protein
MTRNGEWIKIRNSDGDLFEGKLLCRQSLKRLRKTANTMIAGTPAKILTGYLLRVKRPARDADCLPLLLL